MTNALVDALEAFAEAKKFEGKGALGIALVVLKHARRDGLPLNPDKLLTKGGGQVRGAGGQAVKAILAKHGIVRKFASEAGRTNRSSLEKMREFVSFLNNLSHQGQVDFDEIEAFWVRKIEKFFAAKPFTLDLDGSRGLRYVVRNLLKQATERQQSGPGSKFAGAVMQYLVGAKLDCALGEGKITHFGYATADAPGGRTGDFSIGDVAIHVTTAPGEALIERCKENLSDGHRPLIVTTQKGVGVLDGLVENLGVPDRIDVFEIEQFIALNLYELGNFALEGRRVAVSDLVDRYNKIVDAVETDPSLKIDIRGG